MDGGLEWQVSASDTTGYTSFGGEHQNTDLLKLISQNADRDVRVLSASVGNFSAVAINRQLTFVFEQRVSSAAFDSIIDDFSLLEGGFIVIAERSGVIAVGSVDDQLTISQSNKMCQASSEAQTYHRVLFHGTPKGEGIQAKIVAITAGKLFVVNNINIVNGAIDFSEIQFQQIDRPVGPVVDLACTRDMIIAVGPESQWVACTEEGELAMQATLYPQEDRESVGMIRVQTVLNAPIFITMDLTGRFYLWDCITLVVLRTWDIPGVREFRLILDQERFTSLENLQLLLLKETEVCTVTLPSLEPKFVCGLGSPASASVARCPLTQDDILVAECQTVEDDFDVETQVTLKLYSESSPQKRLTRLLSRHRFEEAEELAKLYGLKYELDPSIIQSVLRQRKETYEATEDHLDSCRRKLLTNRSPSHKENVKTVLSEIAELQHRLKAFDKVFGRENFSSEEWELFQGEQPLRLCSVLVKRDPEKAFLLWDCFQAEITERLRPGALARLLASLPREFSAEKVVEWLCDLVASAVCGMDPEAVAKITDWISNRVEDMEGSRQPDWVSNAISLVSSLLASLETACCCSVEDLKTFGKELVEAKMSNSRSLKQLRGLAQSLEEVRELATKFKFDIPLHQLRQESQEGLAFRMLARVPAPNLLAAALRSHILPFIRSRQLVADEIFAKYVEHLIQNQEIVLSTSSNDCKEMVKAVIENITSPKEKIAATLNLVKNIAFPVPDFVAGLVEDILTIKHPLCKTLSEKWAVKEACDIMWRNGVSLSENVVEVAKYLLALNQPLSQAQKVLAAFNEAHRDNEILMFACRLKVERGQLDELVAFIKDLPTASAVKCCQFVLGSAKHMTVEGLSSHLAEALKPKQMLYFEAAERVSPLLLTLCDDYLDQEEVREKMTCISNIKTLQLHYNLAVSEASLGNKAQCLAMFQEASSKHTGFSLLRLGKLLNLEDAELIQSLLDSCADQAKEMQCSDVEKILRLVSQCYSGVQLPSVSVHAVLDLLGSHASDDHHRMLDICLRLTSMLATHCEPEKLAKVIHLSSLVLLTRDLHELDKTRYSSRQAEAVAWDPHLTVEAAAPGVCGGMLDSLVDLGSLSLSDSWSEDATLEMLSLSEDLAEQGQHHVSLRLLHFFKQAVISTDCQALMAAEKTLSSCMAKKLLKSREASLMMALAFCLNLPKGDSVSMMKAIMRACGSDFKRLKRVCAVAEAYAEVIGDEVLIEGVGSAKMVAKWGVRLAKIGISFKLPEKIDIVNKLIKSRYCTVDILKEYYRDFKLQPACFESHLGVYLQHFLSHHAGLTSPDVRQARDIVWAMSDPLPLLRKLLNKTSPYDYPRIRFVLEEIQRVSGGEDIERGLQLLCYLSKYTRVSPPSEEEKQKWGGSALLDAEAVAEEVSAGADDVSVLNLLPRESNLRLPYHMLMGDDLKAVMEGEVNMESLNAWLDMAQVLKLSRDKILLSAVLNVMEKYVSSQEPPPSASLPTTASRQQSASLSQSAASVSAVSAEFLTLLSCVRRIMSMFEKKDHAIWCCNWMLQKLNVEEKKLALKGCINFTQHWLESTQEEEERAKVQGALDMFSKRYLLLSTNAALVRAGLWEAVGGSNRPKDIQKLIKAIYAQALDVLEKAIDVNGAVDTIGGLHDVDVEELRVSLIQEWLQSGSGEATLDLDQTMTFDVTLCRNGSDSSDDLARVMLLLESSHREPCLATLREIAEDDMADRECQAKASFCLIKAEKLS